MCILQNSKLCSVYFDLTIASLSFFLQKVANLKTSRLAYSTFTALPVLLKEEDKRIYQCKRSDGSACQPENYISYANAAALNGVPVGITSNGELDMLKAGIESEFAMKLSGDLFT